MVVGELQKDKVAEARKYRAIEHGQGTLAYVKPLERKQIPKEVGWKAAQKVAAKGKHLNRNSMLNEKNLFFMTNDAQA